MSVPAAGLTLPLAIPNDPALRNYPLQLQAIEVDAGASRGPSFSPLLTLHLGYAYP